MPHTEIKKTMVELKSELTKAPKETTVLEQKLEQAQDGIEQYTPESIQEFVDLLQRETYEFEVDHPQITALVNQVVTALSNLGI